MANKIIETRINDFSGGITNDSRDVREGVSRVFSNFDVFTFRNKLVPYRSSETGDSSAANNRIENFCIAQLNTDPDYAIYGLGTTAGNGIEIYYKKLTTAAANDLDDGDWTETANNTATGAAGVRLFVFYQRTGLIYGARAGTHIFAYDPDGGDVLASTHRALTYSSIGQGFVHSKDDILYIPYYNSGGFIASNNNGTWNNTALTLPIHYQPTSICEYGNFLAVACAHRDGVSNSRVYLWDRNSSLVNVHESIDWGTGSLVILEEVDGELVGISQKGGVGAFPTIPNGTTAHRDSVIFRRLVGSTAIKFLEIRADHASTRNTTNIPVYKQKVDNRLLFQMLIELNGSVRDGIWSIGRTSPTSPLSLVHERTTNNNTALTTADDLNGFYMVGDYLFQSYISSGTYGMTKTDDSATAFSHNSVYESRTFDGRIHGFDASYYKDLLEVSVMTEFMPTAGQITLAYQINQNIGTSTWTTIFTNSTDNSVSHTAMNIESSGARLPNDYKEIAFRILSTGNAVVTGLLFKEEVKGKKFIAD